MIHYLTFLEITNERLPQGRGAQFRQIGPIGLRPALFTNDCHKSVYQPSHLLSHAVHYTPKYPAFGFQPPPLISMLEQYPV
jgi:hypothetical protein